MTTETANATLDIVDIQHVVKIIDLAAEQGAFKGWEMITYVASVRAKFSAFLDMVAAAQKAKEDAEVANTTAAAATAEVAAPTGPTGPSLPVNTADEETALAPGA